MLQINNQSGITGSYGSSILFSFFFFFDDPPSCFPEWLHPLTIPPEITNVGEDAGRREPSDTVGGVAKKLCFRVTLGSQ